MTDQELNFHLQQLSSSHVGEFDSLVALKELYIYTSKYYGELLAALEENPNCRKLALAQRLKSLVLGIVCGCALAASSACAGIGRGVDPTAPHRGAAVTSVDSQAVVKAATGSARGCCCGASASSTPFCGARR